MKLISFFIGTDALLISRWKFPCRPYKRIYQVFIRIRTWFLDFFVDEYWVPHEDMIEELRSFGIKKRIFVRHLDMNYTEKIPKIKHEGFNVLFYWAGDRGNAKFWRWIYGLETFHKIKKELGDEVRWIVADGNLDLNEFFPLVDFYLRVNNHDGYSRLIDECDIQGIPYYWNRTDPDAEEAIATIRREVVRKKSNRRR